MSQIRRKPPRPPAAHPRAVVLILVAGVLTVMGALGASFYLLIHSYSVSAVRQVDAVRAELVSRAGLQEAVARLRAQAFSKTEDPTDPWNTVSWLNGATRRPSFAYGNGKDDDSDGVVDNETLLPTGSRKLYKPYSRVLSATVGAESDRFTLEVEDAASKINVNAGDNLAVMLDNLCRLIGPPLVPADQDLLIPMRWRTEEPNYQYGLNPRDAKSPQGLANRDIYYERGEDGRPVTWQEFLLKYSIAVNDPDGGQPRLTAKVADPTAVYGDGYAIAGQRARHGRFKTLQEVRDALTYVERNGNSEADDPLEQLELEVKFAALRPYLTLDSWVDPTTVCVGKFEWADTAKEQINGQSVLVSRVLVDRDKSWVVDDPANDPLNHRGSLRGCYLSILSGHGAGQLRRIKTNGVDWLEVDFPLVIPPGPISSYLIMAPENALVEDIQTGATYSLYGGALPAGLTLVPKLDASGNLVPDPNLDFDRYPLCIHRAPVNLNTASEKVLAALFLGLNVQSGHPLAVGTDADAVLTGIVPPPQKPSDYSMAQLPRLPLIPATETYWKTWDNGFLVSFFEQHLAPPASVGTLTPILPANPLGPVQPLTADTLAYAYKVTFVTGSGETTGSPATSEIDFPSFDGGTIQITNLPCGDPTKVTGRKIYRATFSRAFKENGTPSDPKDDKTVADLTRANYLLVGSLGDNTTTTFTDTTTVGSGNWPDPSTSDKLPPRLIGQQPYLLTARGLKRIPATGGRLVLDRPAPWDPAVENAFGYLGNFKTLPLWPSDKKPPDYFRQGYYKAGGPGAVGPANQKGTVSEAMELAWRIIVARQTEALLPYTAKDTGKPQSGTDGYRRGPFVSWDDLYQRVVKPWDDQRVAAGWEDVNGNTQKDTWYDKNHDGKRTADEADLYHKASVARLIMAHFNSNTDLLKFNPNIEWIDRWGRNFTEVEPVMVYDTDDSGGDLTKGNPVRPRFNEMMWWPDLSRAPNDRKRDNTNSADGGSTELAKDSTVNPHQIALFTDYLRGFHTPEELDRLIGWETRKIEGSSKYTLTGPCLKWMDAVWSNDLVNTLGRARGSYVVRSLRYKSDEMIDKSDLNRSTTEFALHSSGVYEIRSVGQVLQPGSGNLLAERKFEALVKLYDVWHESTQADFCNGTILPAEGALGTSASGQVTRDADPGVHRRALVTLPEPVVPYAYRLGVNSYYRDLVDTEVNGHDAFGRKKPAGSQVLPDTIANRVLPARYDGQLVLATNTAAYDTSSSGDAVTFLASFNGDLDTDTCAGNGREQAKTPSNRTVRVLDTIGLLGLLNDTQVDCDPRIYDPTDPTALGDINASPTWLTKLKTDPAYSDLQQSGRSIDEVFDTSAVRKNSAAMRALIPANWWENMSCRVGDLRSDGVFLGPVGVSGKDGTLKYAMDLYKRADKCREWYYNTQFPNDPALDAYAIHRRFHPYSDSKEKFLVYPGLLSDSELNSAWRSDGGYSMDFNKSFNDYWSGTEDQKLTGGKKSRALYSWVERAYRDWYLNQRQERLGRFRNFPVTDPNGFTVTMWVKPNWHATDDEEHEFLNASNAGYGSMARGFQFAKLGRFSRAIPHGLLALDDEDNHYTMYAGKGGEDDRYNNLRFETADWKNYRMGADIYGGTHGAVGQQLVESPAFRTQPFRWSCTGFTLCVGQKTRVTTPLDAWVWDGRGWSWSGGREAGQVGGNTDSGRDGTNDPNAKIYPHKPPFDGTPMADHPPPTEPQPGSNPPTPRASAGGSHVEQGYYYITPQNLVPDHGDAIVGYRDTWSYKVSPWDKDTPLYGKRRNESLTKIARPFISTQRLPPPTGTQSAYWDAWELGCDQDPLQRYFKWTIIRDDTFENWDSADHQGQGENNLGGNENGRRYEIRYVTPNRRRLLEPKWKSDLERITGRASWRAPKWTPAAIAKLSAVNGASVPQCLSDLNTVPLDKPLSDGGTPIFNLDRYPRAVYPPGAVPPADVNPSAHPIQVAASKKQDGTPDIWDEGAGKPRSRIDDDGQSLRKRTSRLAATGFGDTDTNYVVPIPAGTTDAFDRYYTADQISLLNDTESGRYYLLMQEYNDGTINPSGRSRYDVKPWDPAWPGAQAQLQNFKEDSGTVAKPVLTYGGPNLPLWSPHAADDDPDQGLSAYSILEELDIGDPHLCPSGLVRKTDNSGFCQNGQNGNSFSTGVSGGVGNSPDYWTYVQFAAWPWTDGGAKIRPRNVAAGFSGSPFDDTLIPTGADQPVFSINNLNGGLVNASTVAGVLDERVLWIYRTNPTDSTNAVLDELKIAGKQWSQARLEQEMTTSRYYLPATGQKAPTFTSQTLMQSRRGVAAQAESRKLLDSQAEWVVLGRVAWNVFTPRFLHENKDYLCSRYEVTGRYLSGLTLSPNLTAAQLQNGFPTHDAMDSSDNPVDQNGRPWYKLLFRGPFDYIQYNYDLIRDTRPAAIDYKAQKLPTDILPATWTEAHLNKFKAALGVDRPARAEYEALNPAVQPHATCGVELEVLNDNQVVAGSSYDPATKKFKAATAFRNPDVFNRFLDANGNPTPGSRARADKLQYRVRFRYPVDQLVKRAYSPGATVDPNEVVNPATHYLLDTPVFDDLSIVYFRKTQVLDFRDMAE